MSNNLTTDIFLINKLTKSLDNLENELRKELDKIFPVGESIKISDKLVARGLALREISSTEIL